MCIFLIQRLEFGFFFHCLFCVFLVWDRTLNDFSYLNLKESTNFKLSFTAFQACAFFYLTEAEATILWPPDVKNWHAGKDLDAGKDWRQEKEMTEDEMVE